LYNYFMFTQVRIKNFRGIEDLFLDNLKQINIFVGDNGIGKSTILDAIYLSINPNNPELLNRTNTFRGFKDQIIQNLDENRVILVPKDEDYWRTFFYQFDFSNLIEIDLSGSCQRNIVISPHKNSDSAIPTKGINNVNNDTSRESNLVSGVDIHFQSDNKNYESSYFQKDALLVKTDSNYIETLSGNYFNNVTMDNIENIYSGYEDIIKKKNKKILLKLLKTVEPYIQDIERGKTSFIINDERFTKAVDVKTYGEGFYKSLYFFVSVLSNMPNGICLFDEIENGFFYLKQCIIWKGIMGLLKEIPSEQIFVTTHSLEMIKHLYETASTMKFLNKISLYRIEKTKKDILQAIHYNLAEFDYAIKENLEVR